MMCGKVLSNILGKPMKAYLTEKITDSIGLGEWSWVIEQKSNGIAINNGCTGVNVDARQCAGFGQLYLNVAYKSGLNHNVCCLIPEWNMVVVRLGNEQNPPEGKHVG